MADPTDPTQELEQELRKALRALQIPPGLSVEEVHLYLPTFAAGIQKLYDLRARQIVSASPSKTEGERQLETAAQQLIIKAIGLRRVVLVQQPDKPGKQLAPRPAVQDSPGESEEKPIGNWDSGVVRFRRHAAIPEGPGPVWEPGDENTYVEDQVKRRTTAPDEIQARFAHHCYWEELIPSPVRFFIRDRDYELVHQGLTQALFRRKVYWTHQLESQLVETTTLGDKEPPASLESQERTDAVVPIQGSVGGTVQARRRPGPKTPPEITMAVQRIVEKTLPDLPLIKKLEQVSEVMDSSTDPVIPIPGLWLRRSPPLRTWSDAAAIEPNVAMKAITGRLKPRAKPDSAN